MVQLVVDNVFLDLYETDPPKLTFSIEDITDTKITSTYSQAFRVPATKNNNDFFKTMFEVNGRDFDVTQRINASILVDGAEFKRGEVRLYNVFVDNSGNQIDYELVFLGESKTFASQVGSKTLQDLDLSEYKMPYTYETIANSWQAYPQGAIDGGLDLGGNTSPGDVIFPLVDFGNTYDGNGLVEQTRIAVGTSRHFTNPDQSWPIQVNRFKPMIRAKAIWDRIFAGTDYTYESEFLNSPLFYHQYVSAWGNTIENGVELPITGSSNLCNRRGNSGQETYVNSTTSVIQFTGPRELNYGYDYGDNYDEDTGIYTCPLDGAYRFRAVFAHYFLAFDNNDLEFQIIFNWFKNGAQQTPIQVIWTEASQDADGNDIYLQSVYGGYQTSMLATYSKDVYFPSLNAGDEIYFQVNIVLSEYSANISQLRMDMYNCRFQCIEAPGLLAVGEFISNKYKQIDFIKDIVTKYRLVIAPDKYDNTKLIIEPWQTYIGSGEIIDATSKLDTSKDFVIQPIFLEQKEQINFKDKSDKDRYNQLNESQFDEVFGSLTFEANNDLLRDSRDITTNLSPTPVSQINGASSTVAEDFIVPHIYNVKSTATATTYEPIVPNTRLLFYNGLKSGGDTWYFEDEAGGIDALTTYPMVSPYNFYPISSATIDLNWQREYGYVQFLPTGDEITPQQDLGRSVYDVFWSSYINSLYNKWTRRVIAYFVFDSEDLAEFSFDDVIFVKDAYYYVERIDNVALGEKESIKVTMIKLDNFTVPQEGFIPLGAYWEDIAQNWENITDNWGEF